MQKSSTCGGGLDRVARWFIFKAKNPNLGTFWWALEWKMLVYFITIWSVLHPFNTYYIYTVEFMAVW
jgi:hypothetical protein